MSPWTVGDVDSHNKGLSPEKKQQWVAVANDALKRCKENDGKDCDAHAIRQANAVVARKGNLEEFSLTIKKAYYDEASQEMRWRADTSDTESDSRGDSMTLELFSDFLERITSVEMPPKQFCSDFWKGGIPYLSVSHYEDQNGDGVPGTVDNVYIDGNVLKAKGRFNNTPLGKACFDAVCESLHVTSDKPKVRVSIAFLDYKHEHKSTGTIYERKEVDAYCKECMRETIEQIVDETQPAGKKYLSGHLIHFALTRVPVNTRTIMEVEKSMTTRKEDAASIVGEELAEELAKKEKELVGKSEALVIRAEAEKCPECGAELDENGKCPKCDADEIKEAHKKPEKKSAVVEAPVEKAEYDFAVLESKIDKMLSLLETPEKPVHPLDGVLSQFKSDFDSVMLSDATVDDKLRSLQEPINQVGNTVIDVVKAESKPVTTEKAEAMKIDRLAETVASLVQRLDLLTTQLSNRSASTENVVYAPAIPQRRNISLPPSLVAKKAESITPTLHDIIMKSVQ